MSIKQHEFLALKQGRKTVAEYLYEFNFLARYAPDDVSTDQRRRNRFLNGLSEELQMAVALHDFGNFQQLVNKTIVAESKSTALEESRKRQRTSQFAPSGSSSRPRKWLPRPPRAPAPFSPRPGLKSTRFRLTHGRRWTRCKHRRPW